MTCPSYRHRGLRSSARSTPVCGQGSRSESEAQSTERACFVPVGASATGSNCTVVRLAWPKAGQFAAMQALSRSSIGPVRWAACAAAARAESVTARIIVDKYAGRWGVLRGTWVLLGSFWILQLYSCRILVVPPVRAHTQCAAVATAGKGLADRGRAGQHTSTNPSPL
jgi:hypothetical protein